MMHDASIRRTLAAALATAVVGVTATSAQAATVVDDLTGGTHDHTVLADNAVSIGAFDEAFNTMPATWTQIPWPAAGTATVASGAMSVDGTRVDSIVPAGPGSSLRFRATFDNQAFQHIGFAQTFGDGTPWAILSTGSGGSGVIARTNDGTNPETMSTEIATTTFAHDFRIDWTPTAIVYYVDGEEKARHTISLTAPMSAQASDVAATQPLMVDSMGLRLKTTGTFTSKVLNSGDPRVEDMTFTPQSDIPAGTEITYSMRSGSTATPGVSWSGWGTPAATPRAQYVQYRAMLSTTDITMTPKVLPGAAVDFKIDSTAPTVTIGTITTNGKSATVPFTSNDAGATYMCSLDGKAFVACKSPAKFDNLSVGPHGIAVRATDKLGNQRTASSSFTIKAPPVGGGGGSVPPDVKAPRMSVPRKLAMAANGKVRLSLACPSDETKCVVKVKLRRHGATVASKKVKLDGGQTRIVSLRLKRSVRHLVEDRGRLKLTLNVSSRDAADNTWTKSKKVTLKPVD